MFLNSEVQKLFRFSPFSTPFFVIALCKYLFSYCFMCSSGKMC